MKRFLFILVVLNLANCISEYELPPETWGELYVSPPDTIGDQIWMSENMNYPVKDSESDSKCYDNDQANCKNRLYNWAGAMSVCPTDWHLPTKEEWEALDASAFPAESGYWWSSNADPEDPKKAYVFYMNSGDKSLKQESKDKSDFYSAHCIKDTSDNEYVGCIGPTGNCIKMPFETCKLIGTVTKECP